MSILSIADRPMEDGQTAMESPVGFVGCLRQDPQMIGFTSWLLSNLVEVGVFAAAAAALGFGVLGLR